jgi:hypothetical protein
MMSKMKRTPVPGKKKLTAEEFRTKHQREFAEDDRSKLQPPASISQVSLGLNLNPEVSRYFAALTQTYHFRLTRQLQEWWLVRLLGAAAEEECPEAYRELLEGWLSS